MSRDIRCSICGEPLDYDWKKITLFKHGTLAPICTKCMESIVADIGRIDGDIKEARR